jgi:hypothetical protein
MAHRFLIVVAADVDEELLIVAHADTPEQAAAEAEPFRADFKVVEIYEAAGRR